MSEAAPETALSLAQKAAQHFAERGLENARLDAELLLADVLGLNRLQLYLQFDRPVTVEELERFRGLVRRRLKREPLQYVVGHTAFRTLQLTVDRRVLIPRPETEVLVGEVVRWIGQRAEGRALDLGTGSGAIALSLASETAWDIVATDVSRDALELARTNASATGLSARIEFRCGDLWDSIAVEERFDAIVSNPPYVSERERDQLAPEVRDWEPARALFAGADGLDVIRAIISQAASHLRPGGLLALELGASQAQGALALVTQAGSYTAERVVRDLAGRDRILLAETSAA